MRFGKMYDQVEIYRLITKPRDVNAPKAHDLQRARLLERKQTFLTQFKLGGQHGRHMEDTAGDVRLSPEIFALAKAQTTGNSLAMEKVKLENEIKQISLLDAQTSLLGTKTSRSWTRSAWIWSIQNAAIEGGSRDLEAQRARGPGWRRQVGELEIVFNDQQFHTR